MQCAVPDVEPPRLALEHKRGNGIGGRSLKSFRRYILDQTLDGVELADHLLFLAGLRRMPDTGEQAPFNVQAKVAVKLAEILHGKRVEKKVEHSGTVRHVPVEAERPAGWGARYTPEQWEQLEALRRVIDEPVEDAQLVEEVTDAE